jgi:hypothetical protein
MMYHSSKNVLPPFPSSINLHSELCKQLLLSLSAMNELLAFMNELVERAEQSLSRKRTANAVSHFPVAPSFAKKPTTKPKH